MESKSLKMLLWVAVVVIAGLAGLNVYQYQQGRIATPISVMPGSVMPSTQTARGVYTNEAYKFSVAYPANFEARDEVGGNLVASIVNKTMKTAGEGGPTKIYVNTTSTRTFDEYYSAKLKELQKMAKEMNVSSDHYTLVKSIVNGGQVIFEKRDFAGILGNVYNMHVWMGDGSEVVFAGDERENQLVLSGIYNSFMRLTDSTKVESPDVVAKNFYNWYLSAEARFNQNYENPSPLSTYSTNKYSSNELVKNIDKVLSQMPSGGHYDPIYCGQDVPTINEFRIVATKITGLMAEVTTNLSKVALSQQDGKWRLINITCDLK